MKNQSILSGAAALLLSGAASAATYAPPSVSASMDVGQTLVFNGVVTLPSGGASQVDVFFLIDDTGSMGSIINNAKTGAAAIMNALPATYRYGVASYDGDPIEGVSAANAFNRRTDLTLNRTTIQTGLNAITAGGGGDFPEAGYYALKQTADTSSWAAASQRLIVQFGDATSHNETVNKGQVISALGAVGAKLIAFNSGAAGGAMDGSYGSEPAGSHQSTDIVAAVGGKVINNFASLSAAQFADAVAAEITSATSFLDLVFGHTFGGSGLGISIACTDALGCNNVEAGAARSFAVTVNAVQAGSYNFDLFTRGLSEVQPYAINVGGAIDPVPEPETYALMLAGLGVVGLAARRRRAKAA